jgi:hypothetical protein
MVQHRSGKESAAPEGAAGSYHLDIHSNNKRAMFKTAFYYAKNRSDICHGRSITTLFALFISAPCFSPGAGE